MTGILRVRNLAQKVLWEEELSGQISDGRWENSSPRNHWEPWCSASVVVDSDNVGRDFYARRDGYCFTEKELLSIVGERMLEAVRVALGDSSYSEKEMLADLRDLRKIIKLRVPSPNILSVPPQREARKAKLIVDGYPQEFTVYYDDVQDDPRAVAALAKRERDNVEYRIKSIQERLVPARKKVEELEEKLAATQRELIAMAAQ